MLIAIMIGVIIVSVQFGYNKYFFTFNDKDGELYKEPVPSPNDTYSASAYYMPYGGAAGGVKIWVEITDPNEEDIEKTVYYAEANGNFSMEWKDEHTLSIVNQEPAYPSEDRSVELNVEKEIYHDRGLACDSWIMKSEYDTCLKK
ncbi:DUF5412 family protein [Gracilibacillus xinjiangensis]|uniref:DUF5412 family protein n=1 Tax=Gracilibacillus xinjiangensis TaxID=1193282 RepID=A0ABV8WVB0_9BACI